MTSYINFCSVRHTNTTKTISALSAASLHTCIVTTIIIIITMVLYQEAGEWMFTRRWMACLAVPDR